MPGAGPWFKRYQALAREILTPPVGWLVETNAGKLYNGAFLRGRRRLRRQIPGRSRSTSANRLRAWSPDRFEQEVTEPRFAGRIDIAKQRLIAPRINHVTVAHHAAAPPADEIPESVEPGASQADLFSGARVSHLSPGERVRRLPCPILAHGGFSTVRLQAQERCSLPRTPENNLHRRGPTWRGRPEASQSQAERSAPRRHRPIERGSWSFLDVAMRAVIHELCPLAPF